MKAQAANAPARAQARGSDLRPSAPSPTPQAEQTAPQADGSLLDNLVAQGSLGEAWAAATAESPAPLPRRAELERRFAASLSHVEVHVGERVDSLLDRLGAIGAARGHQVLLRDTSDAETAAHEVAHVLQASGGPGATAVVRADDEAELEAEALAQHLRRGGHGRVRRRIGRNAIALRKNTRDPVRGALPPLAEDEFPELVEQTVQPEQSALDSESSERTGQAASGEREREAPETEPDAVETEASEVAAEGEQGSAQRSPDADETPAGEAVPAPSPDRRQEMDELLTRQQEAWDEGAVTADGHEVEACPRNRVGRGERPFARGPPLEVPATEELPDLSDPELEEPSDTALTRAEQALDNQVDQVSDRGQAVDGGNIDPDTDQQRRSEQARVRRDVDAALRRHAVETPEIPELELAGEADISARKRAAEDKSRTASQREGDAARERSAEDFGETRMAPVEDPTQGHDTELEQLEIPTVELETEVDEAARARIASEANAGQLSLEEVVVPRDGAMAELRSLAADRAERRDVIDTGIADADEAFARLCAEGKHERERVKAETEGQVSERRETWRTAADERVQEREQEATDLVRDKTEHAERIATDADESARATLESAQSTAETQQQEVEQRARAKAQQSEERSWWQRGVDWVRERLNELVAWIDDFIDRAHQAIDTLLDAASDVAHGFVEAGRRAVTATLDLAHQGVDIIAANLPGELGEIAREHRDDMHAYLDEQQQAVDTWAEDLHQDIDDGIEGLREDLHDGLETFREGVHDVADAANALLDVAEDGIMALLRRYFPSLAAFIDEGILGPVDRAGEQLETWAQEALASSGLDSVTDTLTQIHSARFCQEQTEEEQAADCAAFEARLNSLRDTFDAVLQSPIAQQIQGFMQESQDQARAQQVDAASGFFSFIQEVARPVYDWWQSVEPQVSEALDYLGDMANAAWRHIASALGLDPNLPPLQAIREGLERAWDAISEAVQPLIDRVRQAWQWLTEESPLAPIISFIQAIPEAVSALGELISEIASSAGDWIARAAEALKNTIMPVVQRALGAVSRAINAVVDRVVGWADRLLGAIEGLLSWEPAHRLLQAVMRFVRDWTAPIRVAFRLFRDCGERALRTLAHVVANLVDYARTIADIATGVVQAILFIPVGTAAFLMGNVWRFLVPECYKAPILNFLLDIAIRFVQFFPEPADFLWAAIYQGVLNFLQGLRAAPDDQKVGAIDLLASMMGGNVEVMAGFLVGLVEGVWESTGGTIIFLLQLVGWLLMLPVKLAQWAIGILRGQGPGRSETGGDDTAEDAGSGDDAAEADEPAVAERARGPPGQDEAGIRDSSETRRIMGRAATASDSPTADATSESDMESSAEEESGARVADEADVSGPDVADEMPLEEGADTAALERAGADAEQSTAGTPAGDTGAVAAEGGSEGAVSEEAVDPERPPGVPEALSNLRGTLQQLLTTGFTRQDVQQAMDGVRDMLRQFVGRLARQAAQQLLASLNAQGAAFAIGRAMGSIVGQLVVEVILAIFTGGGSAALTAAKVALRGAQAAGRLASVIRRIRSAAQPLLNAIGRMRGALGQVMGRLRSWLDNIISWMQGVGRRVRGRVQRFGRSRRPGVGRGRPGARAPPRRRPSRRGRRDRDRSRDRRDDRRRRDRRNRERLRRAQRELPPRIRRFLDRGKSRTMLRVRLAAWRIQYRLSVLRARKVGNRLQVTARVNPQVTFPGGISYDEDDLLRMFNRVARRFMREQVPGARSSETTGALDRMREDAAHARAVRPDGPGLSATFRPSNPMDDLILARHMRPRSRFPQGVDLHHGRARPGRSIGTHQQPGGGRFTRSIDPDTGRVTGGLRYDEISARLSQHSPSRIAEAMREMQVGNPVSGVFAGDERALGELRSLLFGTEIQRDQRNLVFSAMVHGLMGTGQIETLDEALALHPAAQRDAMSGFRQVSRELRGQAPMTRFEHGQLARSAGQAGITTDEAGRQAREQSRQRQIELLRRWFATYVHGVTDAGNIGDFEEYIYDWLRHYYRTVT